MWMPRKFTDTPVLWEPEEDSGKVLKRFQKSIEEKRGLQFNDYWDFHKWSVDNSSEFWSLLSDFFGVIFSKKFDKVLDTNVLINESPKWFEGARLNYAENILRYRDDHVALILASEDQETEKVTYAEMYEEAELFAAAFRKFGLKKNDVVVCYMSNRKEAVYAMQAVLSIGAIWTGALPLMGVQPVLNRFQQVKPNILLTVDRFMYDGEEINMLPKVQSIAQRLPSLQKVIIVPSKKNSVSKDISGIPNSCFLDDFLKLGRLADGSVPPMEFEQVSFSHPVLISFTSGTTGLPKALVHGSGVLLGACQFYGLHCNTDRDSIWFSVLPVGWPAWIVFISLHFVGYTAVFYEGFPYFLSPTSIWDLVDEFKLTTLVLPANILGELKKREYEPQKYHSLSSLKFIIAGGSMVKPQYYDFVYKKLNKKVVLNTVYGCTEVMGSALICESTLPVRRGEISAPALGILIQSVNDAGDPVVGEIGELVIPKPIPSLPLGLWGDIDGSIFKEKYFSKYPGTFYLSDFGIINPTTKGYIVCGRSDEVLKRRDYRFGSSEIYNVVHEFPEVRDSLCVSQFSKDMDQRVVLFLRMGDGHSFSMQLVTRLREAIAKELTINHVPDVILETKEIPYNINGKKMEIIVKKIISKMPHTTEAVINQESLKFYYTAPELQMPF